MASMATGLPLGAFRLPARSRTERVLARTISAPSGITCHTSRVPGGAACGLNDRRPAWLAQAHEALDAVVAAAYGWPG